MTSKRSNLANFWSNSTTRTIAPRWTKPRRPSPVRKRSSRTTRRPSGFRTSNSERGGRSAQADAAVNAAKAGMSAVQPDVEHGTERKRQEALLASKATTHQQLEQAVADADRFAGCWPAARRTWRVRRLRLTAAALCSKRRRDNAPLSTPGTLCTGLTFKQNRQQSSSPKSILDIRGSRPRGRGGRRTSCAGGAAGRSGHAGRRPGQGRRLDPGEL